MLDLITPIDLPEEQKRDYLSRIDQYVKELKSVAGGKSVWQLRIDYCKGKTILDSESKKKMDWLIQMEPTILAAFIRVVDNLFRRFHRMNKGIMDLDLKDYEQESALTIVRSIYKYDENRATFTTLVYWSVKNRLLRVVESHEPLAKVGRKTQELRIKVKKLMEEKGIGFDEAIEELRKTEKISKRYVDQTRDSIYTISLNDSQIQQGTAKHSSTTNEVLEEIHLNDLNDLSDLEKELAQARLEGIRGYEAHLARTRINPNTGKLYTRQRLGQVARRALRKIWENQQKAAA